MINLTITVYYVMATILHCLHMDLMDTITIIHVALGDVLMHGYYSLKSKL